MNGFEQLRDAYLSWPSLARESLEEGANAASKAPGAYACVDEVVVCGVGGSGVVGEYLQKVSDIYGGVPISVAKSTLAPRRAGRRTLALGVSFSGTTVETIKCVEAAADAGALVAVVSGKGPLASRAEARGWVYMRVPQGPAARSMFAALFYTALGFLRGLGLVSVPRGEVEASITALADAKIEDEAVKTAEVLRGSKLVVVTAGWELAPVATRAVQELAENSKKVGIPVYTPEALHNFIESVDVLGTIEGARVLALDWKGYTARKLYDHLVSKLSSVVGTVRVSIEQAGVLQALAWSTLFVGLASIHLARIEGADPQQIPKIKEARKVAESL
ncbi:SIS domain-containing protein [Pyrolobus fumarii]|uniref:SIS domain-containing protein n=1 Tax=Pyrolobus fumarii TaxID=54252 RepID=UPI00064F0795|nr:SIS domain-containing protein [Pyrolobus fumarii]